MSTARQMIGGLAGGLILIALVAGGLLLAVGDRRIALVAPPTASGAQAPSPTWEPSRVPTTAAPSDTPTLLPTGACPRPAGWIDYEVQPGDTLASIAERFFVDVVQLQVFNCLLDPVVSPGQFLFVPPPPTFTPSPTLAATFAPIPSVVVCGPPPGWVVYVVQPGDTLSSLARATGTTVERLKLANCLDSDVIRVGQRLYVPRLPFPTPTRPPLITPTFTPTFTPTPPSGPSDTPTPTSILPSDTPTPSVTPTPIEIQSPTPTPTIDHTPTATDTQPPPTATDTPPPPTDTPTPSA